MRSGYNRARKALSAAAVAVAGTIPAIALTVGPVAVFARSMRAEGPLPILLAWAAASAALLRSALRIPKRRRKLSAAAKIAAGVVILAGALLVLVQVNVARRSLAEAWLALARKGEAFGFFSFFAAEVYALFTVAHTAFLSLRKPLAWIAAAAASNALCLGLVFGSGPLLALAVASTALLALALAEGPIRYRLVSLSIPFAAAAILSLLYALYRGPDGDRVRFPAAPDLTAAFARINPAFPLLVDVPGYGFSAGSGDMPASVFLTTRPLWYVAGESGDTRYLADKRYASWNGSAWSLDPDPGPPLLTLDAREAAGPGSLTLTLAEDFYSSIPVDNETAALYFPDGLPDGLRANRNTGARFESSIRRGQRAVLLPMTEEPATEVVNARGTSFDSYLDASANTARMKALAADLLEGARRDDMTGAKESLERRYVAALLEYFFTGFEYSLDAGRPPAGADTNDWFVFERKRGFCVYYASAFTMLAREAGIPARVAEGWRVTVGERGTAVISGSNAHAWPELFIDGAWRVFEPTPPYARADPFAYTREGDRATRRQLRALYGDETANDSAGGPANAAALPSIALITAASLTIAFGLLLFMARVFADERKKTVRRARRAVARAERKGIPRPEISGWLAWKTAAGGAFPEKGALEAAELAERMIELTYRGERP